MEWGFFSVGGGGIGRSDVMGGLVGNLGRIRGALNDGGGDPTMTHSSRTYLS